MNPYNKFKSLRCHSALACLLIGLSSFAFVGGLQALGLLQGRELRFFDQVYFHISRGDVDKRIVLISETESDIRRYGHPLSDQILADALMKLENSGARVIGVDKYRDISEAPGTEVLTSVLQDYDNIVWIFFVGNARQESIPAPQALKNQPERIGFNDIVEDADGVTRRGLLFLDVDDHSYYAFSLLIALHYLAHEGISAAADEEGNFSLNGVSLPPIDSDFGAYRHIDAGGYQVMLDYPGLPQRITSFTLSELLDGKIVDASLRDKIVLIGSSASSLHDHRLIPGDIRIPGVEYHAYLISQLLNAAIEKKSVLKDFPDAIEYFWQLVWCFIGALTGLYRGCLRCMLLLIAAELLSLLLSGYFLLANGCWLPLIAPAAGWGSGLGLSTLYFATRARLERRQIMQLFASHVSPEVASRVWEAREQFFSEGRVRPDVLTATVLFTDLSNFTTVAESMEPLVLMNWLNRYMDEMSRIVTEQGGIVNKYIGDSIMAIFGVPVKRETESAIAQDAQHALKCAVGFNRRLLELNEEWRQLGLPTITMRTGIYTGALVAGSFGGTLRMEYTVIGDTVNTASRLESFDKTIAAPTEEHPCRILIGESTYAYVRDFCDVALVGECCLKGKHKPINIYRVLNVR